MTETTSGPVPGPTPGSAPGGSLPASLTADLISVDRRHQAHAGVRITDI